KYDFAMLNLKGGPEAEFMFCCVCNYDLCNSRTTFNAYLSNMKLESMSFSSVGSDRFHKDPSVPPPPPVLVLCKQTPPFPRSG
ncbi:hypothetical protein AAVH_19243, partial [Aphelenchoides avenae]